MKNGHGREDLFLVHPSTCGADIQKFVSFGFVRKEKQVFPPLSFLSGHSFVLLDRRRRTTKSSPVLPDGLRQIPSIPTPATSIPKPLHLRAQRLLHTTRPMGLIHSMH